MPWFDLFFMTDNEYKYARLVALKNIVLILATAGAVCALYYWSRSFWSLLALLMLIALSTVKTK